MFCGLSLAQASLAQSNEKQLWISCCKLDESQSALLTCTKEDSALDGGSGTQSISSAPAIIPTSPLFFSVEWISCDTYCSVMVATTLSCSNYVANGYVSATIALDFTNYLSNPASYVYILTLPGSNTLKIGCDSTDYATSNTKYGVTELCFITSVVGSYSFTYQAVDATETAYGNACTATISAHVLPACTGCSFTDTYIGSKETLDFSSCIISDAALPLYITEIPDNTVFVTSTDEAAQTNTAYSTNGLYFMSSAAGTYTISYKALGSGETYSSNTCIATISVKSPAICTDSSSTYPANSIIPLDFSRYIASVIQTSATLLLKVVTIPNICILQDRAGNGVIAGETYDVAGLQLKTGSTSGSDSFLYQAVEYGAVSDTTCTSTITVATSSSPFDYLNLHCDFCE